MNTQNIISNKFNLNWSTSFSYNTVILKRGVHDALAYKKGFCENVTGDGWSQLDNEEKCWRKDTLFPLTEAYSLKLFAGVIS